MKENLEDLKRQMFSCYESPFLDDPPPLKNGPAFNVIEALGETRGDPAELRNAEALIKVKGDQVMRLQSALNHLRDDLLIKDMRIAELEKTVEVLKAENGALKATQPPIELEDFEDILKMISREKAVVAREKESLMEEKRGFQVEKQIWERLKTANAKSSFAQVSLQTTVSSVLAQKVFEFLKQIEGSSKYEIQELRQSLEQVLLEKIKK